MGPIVPAVADIGTPGGVRGAAADATIAIPRQECICALVAIDIVGTIAGTIVTAIAATIAAASTPISREGWV